ncbi:histidine--tRNA ligase [Patescibacteria group bacterium]|nr:histidine--tRNA ligase [Patescibacteria group bacterium]MBU1612947.1 histidine--tRNA ligase [Patescibacteria group bacterium]
MVKIKKFVKDKNIGKEKKPVAGALPASAVKSKKAYNSLRGMHDILPREEKYWKTCFHSAENLAEHFQFGRIETPILEEAGLFVRSIGRGTDVVDKEMYIFEDNDGDKVCLRPEATASVVRAFINHGMFNYPQPVKVWYWGQMFRHDRPQAGRYRQFHQVGFENFGDKDPAADAELILIAYNIYKDLGVPVEIHINSIGNLEERGRYRAELLNYYRGRRAYLCDDCKARLSKNPLRLLDCKETQCQPIKEEAPQIIDWLGEESKKHFMRVLEYLDELAIPYILRSSLVRGLDYYTNTVFEVYPITGEGTAQSALGGGGRYDLLVEEMGGRPTPAVGMALGIERSISVWKQYNDTNKIEMPVKRAEVFFAQLGEQARSRTMKIINDMRKSGLKVGFNFFKNSLKSQLELANNHKIPFAVILGQKEVQDGTAIIRDMESGVQEIVDQKKVESVIKKKLNKA